MTRISLDAPIDDKLRDVFAAASNNRQPPLNLHRQMLPSPAALVAYHGMRQALEVHGVLDLRTRFALMLAVSSAEQVPYTIAVNSVLATRAGFSAEDIDAIVQGHSSEDP